MITALMLVAGFWCVCAVVSFVLLVRESRKAPTVEDHYFAQTDELLSWLEGRSR